MQLLLTGAIRKPSDVKMPPYKEKMSVLCSQYKWFM